MQLKIFKSRSLIGQVSLNWGSKYRYPQTRNRNTPKLLKPKTQQNPKHPENPKNKTNPNTAKNYTTPKPLAYPLFNSVPPHDLFQLLLALPVDFLLLLLFRAPGFVGFKDV